MSQGRYETETSVDWEIWHDGSHVVAKGDIFEAVNYNGTYEKRSYGKKRAEIDWWKTHGNCACRKYKLNYNTMYTQILWVDSGHYNGKWY